MTKVIDEPKLSTPGKVDLARLALANDLPGLSKVVAAIPGNPAKAGTTKFYAVRFLEWFADQSGPARFSVFMETGNSKLPFYAFSSLPGFDCPGAGACLYGEGNKHNAANFGKGWCYSFTAWRYPAAFFRQLQNSLLLRSEAGRAFIADKFQQIPAGKTVRLYVDGDFPSLDILEYWMNLCKTRPDLSLYGYSKSWEIFLALDRTGYAWPENYKLNLSGGSRYAGQLWIERMERLPITRGQFLAVPVDRKFIKARSYQDKTRPMSNEYRAEVRQAMRAAGIQKGFACPGNCGNCLPKGQHACGSLPGPIAIGIHN
jgi:hypothetical protein